MSQWDKKADEIKIDWDLVKGMAQVLAPIQEISKATGLNRTYLNKKLRADFPEEKSIEKWLEKQYAIARVDIRRIQFQLAEKGGGSAKVAVWLGIQYLGQSASVGTLEKPKDSIPEPTAQEKKEHAFTGRGTTQVLPAPKKEAPPAKTAPAIDAILVDEETNKSSPINHPPGTLTYSAHTGDEIDG